MRSKMWPQREIALKSGIDLGKVRKKYGIKLSEFAEKCNLDANGFSMLVKFLMVKLAEVEEEGRQTA